jgi:GT2 family glycosyltransferase
MQKRGNPAGILAAHLMATFQVIAVLYKRSFDQSESLSSLFAILERHPEWAPHFSLLIYDNSPNAQALTAHVTFPVAYVHDPSNGGLATAYNAALTRAEKEQREWLLLLDQDTCLTTDFLCELLDAADKLQASPEVAAIVPKLMVKGAIHSPAPSFASQLRQLRSPRKPIYLNVEGIQLEPLSAYNSGATLRVSALRAIGGFPAEYWLDFLDHAVFHKLFSHGYRTYVMRTRLAHDFSGSDVEHVPTWRQKNVLKARTLFVRQSGTFVDRLIYRLWLLRHARRLRQSGADQKVWRATALEAFRLRAKPKD